MTDKSTSGSFAILYSLRLSVNLKIASVRASVAGPPDLLLYLIPKSSSGPPGLWLAVKMIPPVQKKTNENKKY